MHVHCTWVHLCMSSSSCGCTSICKYTHVFKCDMWRSEVNYKSQSSNAIHFDFGEWVCPSDRTDQVYWTWSSRYSPALASTALGYKYLQLHTPSTEKSENWTQHPELLHQLSCIVYLVLFVCLFFFLLTFIDS